MLHATFEFLTENIQQVNSTAKNTRLTQEKLMKISNKVHRLMAVSKIQNK